MKIDLIALIVVILATAYQFISLSAHKVKSDESDLALYVLAICVQGIGFLFCLIRLGLNLKNHTSYAPTSMNVLSMIPFGLVLIQLITSLAK
jgi:hypothetical protein